MIEILAYLENGNGYTNIDCIKTYHLPECTTEISNIYAQSGAWSFEIAAPHSGNGGRFLLRANPTATLDRWSTADYEMLYDSWMDVVRDLDYENYIADVAQTEAWEERAEEFE